MIQLTLITLRRNVEELIEIYLIDIELFMPIKQFDLRVFCDGMVVLLTK